METEQTTTDDDVISARKAAGMLGITVHQLQKWRPYIPHELRPDGRFVYRTSRLEEFIRLRGWDRDNPEPPDHSAPRGGWPYLYDATVDLDESVVEALSWPGKVHIHVPNPDIIVLHFGMRSLVLRPSEHGPTSIDLLRRLSEAFSECAVLLERRDRRERWADRSAPKQPWFAWPPGWTSGSG